MWGEDIMGKPLRILILIATMLLAACNSTSGYRHQQRAEILELPAYLETEGEYMGIVEPIKGTKTLKTRSYKAPIITWNSYLEVGDLTKLRGLSGSRKLSAQDGNFKEILQVDTTSIYHSFNSSFNSNYPKSKKYVRKLNSKFVAEKIKEGSQFKYEEEKESTNLISRDGRASAQEILYYTTGFLDDTEVQGGDLKTIPLINEKGKKFGSHLFKVNGLTFWKERPSIVIEVTGSSVVKDKSSERYKVKTKGYALIDEYTGTVVLMDVVSQLDNERNAAYFSREVLEIDLDKDTPILSDQLVMFNQKAAQL